MSDLTDNQVRGHKANMSNPNTSEESKEHSKEVLHAADVAGHKSNLSDPSSSKESKKDSKEILQSLDGADTVADTPAMKENDAAASEHENRVLGGHKANLSNPNTSDEAKQYSKEILEEAQHQIE